MQACAEYSGGATSSASVAAPGNAAAPNSPTVDPKILNAISKELQKKLSKKNSVMVDPDPETIPVGALIISGCIVNAQKGHAMERMVGLGLGASRLNTHVVALRKTETGFTPVDSFDVQVKGRTILPPVGPAGVGIHAARQPRLTLSADAKKLAGRIVKKLNSDMKQSRYWSRSPMRAWATAGWDV